MEKLFEYKKYSAGHRDHRPMDYLNPLGNNLAYVMAARNCSARDSERAQTIRV
jgi:NADH:ubiquinone oxidoreductase subunit D